MTSEKIYAEIMEMMNLVEKLGPATKKTEDSEEEEKKSPCPAQKAGQLLAVKRLGLEKKMLAVSGEFKVLEGDLLHRLEFSAEICRSSRRGSVTINGDSFPV